MGLIIKPLINRGLYKKQVPKNGTPQNSSEEKKLQGKHYHRAWDTTYHHSVVVVIQAPVNRHCDRFNPTFVQSEQSEHGFKSIWRSGKGGGCELGYKDTDLEPYDNEIPESNHTNFHGRVSNPCLPILDRNNIHVV